jgi:hypothetical protein
MQRFPSSISPVLAVAFIIFALASIAVFEHAAADTNVTSTLPNYFAWNDSIGWIDFYGTLNIQFSGTRLTGYASSAVGYVSLDCATSPAGNVCGASEYGICNGPGPHSGGLCPNGDAGDTTSGALTGYAWNDAIGWISMNCDQSTHGGSNLCGTSNYKVSIDANGDLSGWAWNDVVGWISFNCASAGSTCPPNYKVNTLWRSTSSLGILESSTFDTQSTPGAVLNSIIWQGTLPNGTCVDFQIATSSNSGGPWNYAGPGASAVNFFGAACSAGFLGGQGCAPPDTPICIDPNLSAGARYLRYQVRLKTDRLQTLTPQVDQIILNWSK